LKEPNREILIWDKGGGYGRESHEGLRGLFLSEKITRRSSIFLPLKFFGLIRVGKFKFDKLGNSRFNKNTPLKFFSKGHALRKTMKNKKITNY